MPSTDLCTLAQLKTWITDAPASSNDALFAALITSASGAILGYLNRNPPNLQSYVDTFDGWGERSKLLRRWPVISVSSVTIDNTSVTQSLASAGGGGYPAGWALQPWDGLLPGRQQALDLRCWTYCRGQQNIVVAYKAGYYVSGEAQTVPAGGGTVTTNQLNGPWAIDGGVSYATGGALTLVTGAPATGQYQLSPTTPGQYVFAAGDAGKGVLISYSYAPSALNQACMELVGEAYRYRTRQGQRSHAQQGNTTVSFDLSRLTPAVKMMVDPYRAVVPVV